MTMAPSSVKNHTEDDKNAPQQHPYSHSNSTYPHSDNDLRKNTPEHNHYKKKKRKSKRKNEAMEDSKDTLTESDNRPIASKRRNPTETRRNGEDVPSDPDDDDDEDEDLLAAAAMWARENTNTNRKEKSENGKKNVSEGEQTAHPSTLAHVMLQPQSFSLHITQLPFDSSDMDLRKFFSEQGCALTSIRLVYDRDVQGHKTVFRGVAFVDMLDEASYERALKLNHKASIRGRKLNIRPTRSKQELANIVSRTKELVRERIQQQRTGDVVDLSTPKPEKNKNDNKGRHTAKSSSKKDAQTSGNSKGKEKRTDKEGKPIKITKKQRNRRAAIIMGLKTKTKESK